MARKDELLAEAEALGIEGLTPRSRIADIEAAIRGRRKAVRRDPVFTVEQFEANPRVLGVPRSVIVGAKSGGFLRDGLTVAEAREACRKFSEEYTGGTG